MRTSGIALLAVLVLVCARCSTSPTAGGTQTTNITAYSAVQLDSMVLRTTNDFAFRLLHDFSGDPICRNVVISPLGVSIALGILLNGARGTTHDQMSEVLGYSDLTDSQTNETYERLCHSYDGYSGGVFRLLMNSVWYDRSLTPKQPFVDAAERYFRATVRALDFQSPFAADTINAWVAEGTNNLIPSVADPTSLATSVLGTFNTVYFDGSWATVFGEASPDTFDGRWGPAPCILMKQGMWCTSYRADSFVVAEIPYTGGTYAMTIVLPDPGHSLPSVVGELSSDSWDRLREQLEPDSGLVFLPEFSFSYRAPVTAALARLGMDQAFNPGADFSGISDAGGFIGYVNHRAYIAVDRYRTTAAAVTEVWIPVAYEPPPKVVIRVDRPFLFCVTEKQTGLVVFAGWVCTPA